MEIVHSFIWLPDQQGTVTADGWLNFNGHYDLRVFGGCAGIIPAIQ